MKTICFSHPEVDPVVWLFGCAALCFALGATAAMVLARIYMVPREQHA